MNLEKLSLGISNPELLARKLSQFYNYSTSGERYNPNGLDMMNEDWDICIILDGCRYDLFDEVWDGDEEVNKVESRGSATPEFQRGNLHGNKFLDTVYVNTNPMMYHFDIDVEFCHIENLWDGDTWNEEHGTVMPETVAKSAKELSEEYPNKRLLIHYMQPHYPFIESDFSFDEGHIGHDSPDELTTWMQIITGHVDIERDEIWDAYKNNLKLVLPSVRELVDELTGKMVITSDHGNMFGERSSPIPYREWGHPQGIWTEELINVPWVEKDNTPRRKIESASRSEIDSEHESSAVSERLETLGYLSDK